RHGLPRRERGARSAAHDGGGAAGMPARRAAHHHQPLPQPAASGGADAAGHRSADPAPGLDDDAPPPGDPRPLHAPPRTPVEDVTALAVHDRGGAQRQGVAVPDGRAPRRRSVTEALDRRDGNDAAPDQQIGLALPPGVEPALEEPQRVLLAPEEPAVAALGEDANQLRAASGHPPARPGYRGRA